MNQLFVVAPAKINLHLEVLGLRPDGFHELAMVMQTINLSDSIEIKESRDGFIHLSCDSKELSTQDDNLINRSAQLLIDRLDLVGLGAQINLKKNIPIGAGLAGGSADAAATLVGLNELWKLGLSMKELEGFASELGSDIPFCLSGGTQLCFGRGEKLEPRPKLKSSMAIILVKDPLVSVSTPWAYSRFKDLEGKKYLKDESDYETRREALRGAEWIDLFGEKGLLPLRNDLQDVVASVTPAVRSALNLLAEFPGSLGVAMSGSGPSCFAVFPSLTLAKSVFSKEQYRLKEAGLMSWCCELGDQGVKIEK